MSTRQAVRAAQRKNTARSNFYVSHFLALLHNSFEVEGLPKDCPKRYYLGVLFRKGGIGHYGAIGEDLYLPYSGIGINMYGLPRYYTLISYTGKVITKPAEEVGIMRINDLAYPIIPFIRSQAQKIVDFDNSIEQNLEACRTMTVGKCRDKETLLSLQNAYYASRCGSLVAFIDDKDGFTESFTTFSTGAQYLVDRLMADRAKVIQETLEVLGIATSVNKQERVQGIEVATSNIYAMCNIRTIRDTHNHDAEESGVPVRLKINPVLAHSYDINVYDSQATIEPEGEQVDEKDTEENKENKEV